MRGYRKWKDAGFPPLKNKPLTKAKEAENTIYRLIRKYGPICWYCGITLEESFHIDHITAKSQGGTNKIENLALSCPFCNLAKNNKPVKEFLIWLKHIKTSEFNHKIEH